tara:strand:+ start:331 stop:936 length:606 start_codon:yes stop_codon:yes gene_type:complete
MTDRKKKLRIIQLILLTLGSLIIFFTYYGEKKNYSGKILTPETQNKIRKQLNEKSAEGDTFFNISYSGLDLSGNRYVLKSKEAKTFSENKEIVNMKFVEAIFYFKDETVLNIRSNEGIYNNRTLDMTFEGDVKAMYEKSELFANKAEYSNSKSFLIVSDNVKVKDAKGTVVADKLLFDINKQTLKIASFDEDKINANIDLK